eukprot:NODE_519_length_6551_cov_0.408246.p2 type:complete len:368 gc:universal NODE_519_length_6551_cov_0.408246:1871-768(-)
MSRLNQIIVIFMLLRIYSISPDCPMVLNFFKGLNMHLTDPIEFQQIPADCCGYNSISGNLYIKCSLNNVTAIRAGYMNLNGTVQPQLLPLSLKIIELDMNVKLKSRLPNGLPNSITYIDIYGSAFYGAIPQLPDQLYELEIRNNKLNGTIPVLPVNLVIIRLEGNQFTGNLINIPSQLKTLDCSHNSFTGNFDLLPDTIDYIYGVSNHFDKVINKLPANLVTLYLSYNLIPGPLPNSWPSKLKYIYLYNNKITGSIPDSLLSMPLINLELYNNQLSDSLNTVLNCVNCNLKNNQLNGSVTLQQPTLLDLSNNLFTDVNMMNDSMLATCNLLNNPLNAIFINNSFASRCAYKVVIRISRLFSSNQSQY